MTPGRSRTAGPRASLSGRPVWVEGGQERVGGLKMLKGVSDRRVVVGESWVLLKCGRLLPDPAVM